MANHALERDVDSAQIIGKQPKIAEEEAFKFLSTLKTFAKLPTQELKELANSCRCAAIDTGEYITIEGDEDLAGFIVVSGRLSMIKTSLSGKELAPMP